MKSRIFPSRILPAALAAAALWVWADDSVRVTHVVCYSTGNDAINSNYNRSGAVSLTGGTVVAFSSRGGAEMGIDCDNMSNVLLSGGTLYQHASAPVAEGILFPFPEESVAMLWKGNGETSGTTKANVVF